MISLGGMSTVLPAPDGSFNGDDKWRFLGLHDTDTDPSVVRTTFPQRTSMMNLGIPGGQILMIVSDGGINAGDRKILLGLFDGAAGSSAGFIGGSYGGDYIIDFDAGGW